MDGLRQKLESQGLKDVTYMVVNHHGKQAQQLHPMLRKWLSQNITLYKQEEGQKDVWQTLSGEKDDFLVYDRCGRLTRQISLPYSIIGHGHIEGAIREAYCSGVCGACSHEPAETQQECQSKPTEQPNVLVPPVEPHGHHQGHHHGHHHGHGHHGNHQGSHGVGHGGHHHSGQGQTGVGQQVVFNPDLFHMQDGPQEAQGAQVMQRP